MKKYLKNRNGGALIMVILVMLILTILGSAVLRIAAAENIFAAKNEDKLQAHYIARSGAVAVAEYMIQLGEIPDGFVGNTSSTNYQIGGGEFTVSINKDENDKVIVTSESLYNNTKAVVK